VVNLRSVPFGTVFINGREIQDTDLFGYEMPPGDYIIEIRKEGYQTWADTVTIEAGNRYTKRVTLILNR